jgi:serine/threonine protein kinase
MFVERILNRHSIKCSFLFLAPSGLRELHAAGFVHADLKPSNIGWSTTSAGYRLTDFGISFHLTEGVQIHAVQTWGFIAPETASWNAKLDVACPTAPRRRVSWLQPENDVAHLVRGLQVNGGGVVAGRRGGEVCPLSPKIDVWSMACVVYQVRLNFTGTSSRSTLFIAFFGNRAFLIIFRRSF